MNCNISSRIFVIVGLVVLFTLGGMALPSECQAQERLRRVFGLVNGIMRAVDEAERREARQLEVAPQRVPENFDPYGLQRPTDRRVPEQISRRQIDPRPGYNDYGLYRPDDRRGRAVDPRAVPDYGLYRPEDRREIQRGRVIYDIPSQRIDVRRPHPGHGHGRHHQPVIEYPKHYQQICSCTEQLRQQVCAFRQKLAFFQYFPEYRPMDCIAQNLIKLSYQADALGRQGPGAFGALKQTLCQMDEQAERLCELADRLEDRTDDGRDRRADKIAEHLEDAADDIEDITDDLRGYAP